MRRREGGGEGEGGGRGGGRRGRGRGKEGRGREERGKGREGKKGREEGREREGGRRGREGGKGRRGGRGERRRGREGKKGREGEGRGGGGREGEGGKGGEEEGEGGEERRGGRGGRGRWKDHGGKRVRLTSIVMMLSLHSTMSVLSVLQLHSLNPDDSCCTFRPEQSMGVVIELAENRVERGQTTGEEQGRERFSLTRRARSRVEKKPSLGTALQSPHQFDGDDLLWEGRGAAVLYSIANSRTKVWAHSVQTHRGRGEAIQLHRLHRET